MNLQKKHLAILVLLASPALLLACGGGGGGRGVEQIDNPGLELFGIWTGTFTDQDGDYTVALDIDGPSRIDFDEPAYAVVAWGAESLGLEVFPDEGDFVEIEPGRYSMEYNTFDPDTGDLKDTVTGTLVVVEDGFVEGTFSTTSGTFGEFSFARSDGVDQDVVAGRWVMEFSDPDTREVFWAGEIVFDVFGNLVPRDNSFLTDDVEGDIDPGANVWDIVDGYLMLQDPDFGYFEGEIFFEDAGDTIFVAGYLGLDFFVYAGIFEDFEGPGLFTFYPVE